jgi:hypothetical protein
LARRSLKPQLNQIRTWVRQGRTDAWIAHQLDVSVGDIRSFKRDHDLAPDSSDADGDAVGVGELDEPDLRAEDDALVAAALEAEAEEDDDEDSGEGEGEGDDDNGDKPRKRRRGRRGGRGRRKRPSALEGTFDHGDEGYGLWLDPAVQDDPVYAEHWAGHRPVNIVVEPERIVITRSGEEPEPDDD